MRSRARTGGRIPPARPQTDTRPEGHLKLDTLEQHWNARLLRRGLLEVLHRQTEFNRASHTLVHQFGRQVEHLHARIEAQDEQLAAASQRAQLLEADLDLPERGEEPAVPRAPRKQD
jgi:hypothetical protein